MAYFEADHADGATIVQPKQFPTATNMVTEAAACKAGPGGKCVGSPPAYTNATWVALNFNIADPHLFVPSYDQGGVGTNSTFTGGAHGDLDEDGIFSTFLRMGKVNPGSGDVESAAAAYINNEIE